MAFHAEGVARAKDAGRDHRSARLGGGTVESYPEDTEGRKVSASFLHNGTVAMFENHGFERTRRIGKHHWVVTKVVPGAPRRAAASRRSRLTIGNQWLSLRSLRML
jgi:hypothetical protein